MINMVVDGKCEKIQQLIQIEIQSLFNLWKSIIYHLHFMQTELNLRLQQNDEFSFGLTDFHRNASANHRIMKMLGLGGSCKII